MAGTLNSTHCEVSGLPSGSTPWSQQTLITQTQPGPIQSKFHKFSQMQTKI